MLTAHPANTAEPRIITRVLGDMRGWVPIADGPEPVGNVTSRSLYFRPIPTAGRVRLSDGEGLPEDGVDALVGDVFFVVEGSDVGRDEGFDAVSESSCGFGEGHPGA